MDLLAVGDTCVWADLTYWSLSCKQSDSKDWAKWFHIVHNTIPKNKEDCVNFVVTTLLWKVTFFFSVLIYVSVLKVKNFSTLIRWSCCWYQNINFHEVQWGWFFSTAYIHDWNIILIWFFLMLWCNAIALFSALTCL